MPEPPDTISPVGCNLAAGELALPRLALSEPALEHNLAVMADYATKHGFVLAPHGKTTMAPELFRRQLAAGAVAITVANVTQAAIAFSAGSPAVLIANEVVARADAQRIATLLAVPGRELHCLVDTVPGVGALDTALHAAGFAGTLAVLVELGAPDRRAGARSIAEAEAVAAAVAESAHLRLVGVESFEGALAGARSSASLGVIDGFLEQMRALTVRLADSGAFSGEGPILVSAGGSKFFDRVAEILGPNADYGGHHVRLVVRAGCYLTHDHGIYAENSPLAGSGPASLRAALELWAEVLSRPEEQLAIVGLGKRDASFDLGLPVPLRRVRAAASRPEPFTGAQLRSLDDQHGYLVLEGSSDLSVGDRIGFGLSHPCTVFDRWRSVLLVDEQTTVLEEIETCFH